MNIRRNPIGSVDELMGIAATANVLAEAAELSFHDPDAAMDVIQDRLPDSMPDFGLACLRMAVMEMIARHIVARNHKGSEFDVHRHFWANLQRYLPGAERIESKSNQFHKTDGWVRLDGVDIPVEMKRDEFTIASARQLARYMTEYGASRGIAVAKEIRCPRDPRVIYIEYDATAI